MQLTKVLTTSKRIYNNMRKQIITIATIGVLGTMLAFSAFAQTVSPTLSPRLQKRQEAQQTQITNLQTRAQNEITRRLNSLSSLTTKLGDMKHLTATQIASFTTNITNEENSLKTLAAKISGDTNIATLRTDMQSIVKSYRVYALYLPQINIMATADKLLNVSDMISAYADKLQQRLQELSIPTTDQTTLTNTMKDLRQNLSDANTQAQQAITTVLPLTPDGYPANKTILQTARTQYLTAARKDLKNAWKDAVTIRAYIKAHKTVKVSGTPLPSSTPTPSK